MAVVVLAVVSCVSRRTGEASARVKRPERLCGVHANTALWISRATSNGSNQMSFIIDKET
jgi:hypothetical protein